jgi:hypothetical protein
MQCKESSERIKNRKEFMVNIMTGSLLTVFSFSRFNYYTQQATLRTSLQSVKTFMPQINNT